ncbi:hypothetical protein CQA49_00085 [Helicobacter sp. MIT 00-7814]|uniref:hypothetical protein n=1 Tax=unclassified Helicobacter TaxID=2593540 RepID=UPI000E1F0F9F|nr:MULTISPECIES: hypothetical protein [unclassified Helicobacter]RDU57103.1 hypothetical protein CQA49_00085 [Helicobacter sp. MIT 00-7814]RDU57654.1 hypothetical protein CQA37_00085 [Helicobacter sp. MIT 99-10781]
MTAKPNTKYALLDANDTIARIFDSAELSEWNEEQVSVVEITQELESVREGLKYDRLTNSIILPSLSEEKELKIAFINANLEVELSSLKQGCSESEVLSWDLQKQEANAFLSSKDPLSAPFLNKIATVRELSLEDLANKVIQKNTQYNEELSTLLANAQILRKEIDSATTLKELEAITYTSPFAKKGQENV